MENISSYIDGINTKIEKLVHLHRSLSEQVNNLTAEKQELVQKINSKDQEINQLNENFKILTITKTLAGASLDKENADAKSKINELVREIDRSIALLNK